MTRSTIPILMLVGWIVLAAGTGLYLWRDFDFASEAQKVIGTVTWKHEHVHYSRGFFHAFHYSTYYAGYTYPAGSREQSGVQMVEADTYAILVQGGSVPVRYLRDDPTQSRIDLSSENQFISLISWCWMAITAGATFGLWRVWREYLSGEDASA